ncbi:MAG: hypothetical protein QXE31_05835 [Candidatus Woesearchaeota archaeon]
MNKLKLLVKKLKNSLLKNEEIDAITIIELEELGFKIYPPTQYPEKN